MTISFDANDFEELIGQAVRCASSTRFWDELPNNYPYGAGVFMEAPAKNLVDAILKAYEDLPDALAADDETLQIVGVALKAAGLSDEKVIDSIVQMQNAGIFFRERAEKVKARNHQRPMERPLDANG